MNQFSRPCAPNRVRELAALAQALITLGSQPQTGTEQAREKGKKNRVYGIINQFFLSCASR
jgi:hypothetical protein